MEQILQKLPNENESQYIWKIGQAKDSGLIDSTWEELTPILNTQCGISEEDFRGSSAWRKRYRVMPDNFSNNVASSFNSLKHLLLILSYSSSFPSKISINDILNL